jgi:hypothetical protein
VLGWLFKNHERTVEKTYVFIFMAPTIVKPRQQPGMGLYTKMKLHQATREIEQGVRTSHTPDPLYNWFFNEKKENYSHKVIDFANARYQPTTVDIKYDPYYRAKDDDDDQKDEEVDNEKEEKDSSDEPDEPAGGETDDTEEKEIKIVDSKQITKIDSEEKKREDEIVPKSVAVKPEENLSMPGTKIAGLKPAQKTAAKEVIKLKESVKSMAESIDPKQIKVASAETKSVELQQEAANVAEEYEQQSHPIVERLKKRMERKKITQLVPDKNLDERRKKLKSLVSKSGIFPTVDDASSSINKKEQLKEFILQDVAREQEPSTQDSRKRLKDFISGGRESKELNIEPTKRKSLKGFLSPVQEQAVAA